MNRSWKFFQSQISACSQNRCHILAVIARRKDNERIQSYNNNIIHRAVVTQDYWKGGLRKLKAIKDGLPYSMRTYLTINSRDMSKAWSETQKTMNDASLVDDKPEKLASVGSEFKKSLQRKNARYARNKLLIDVDSKDISKADISAKIDESAIVFYETETPNGFHIVTDVFDIRGLKEMDDVEIHNDAMTLVPGLLDEVNFK